LSRRIYQLESNLELARASERQERGNGLEKMRRELGDVIDKVRGELGRRIDEIATELKDLNGYRWKLVGFITALSVMWTIVTVLITLYFARR
jgi:hypothetical protein